MNTDYIDYLVGHRGKGVDVKHYNKFYDTPKESTADLLEVLEEHFEQAQAQAQ